MNLSRLTGHRTSPVTEARGRTATRRVDAPTWLADGLDLDLVDIMLDLDPGALEWNPARESSPVMAAQSFRRGRIS
jgi:hypothetical protein